MKTIKNLDLSIGQKNTKSDTAAAGKTLPFSSEIDLAFTQDDEDLNKIFTLRSTIYHKDLGFEVPIDQHDIKSLHLKVTHGELIIGCARLVPRSPGTLPLENQGFLLDDYLHKHQKCKLKIAEISRIAIVEDYRKDPK
ncbi:MAG: GNAT family N-acetyltransferase, partial [Chitinophagaceae bacterium]